jgi:hypothetical protein
VFFTDLLSELARREQQSGIMPEAEVDLFMKVHLLTNLILHIIDEQINLS